MPCDSNLLTILTLSTFFPHIMLSNLSVTTHSFSWLNLAPEPAGRGVRMVSAALECGFTRADKFWVV